MVNVLYFWLSEETEEFVYEIIIMTESIISIISNLISFVIFYLKPPPKEDMLTGLLKWTRLVDIILPLTSGILLKGRVLFPFLGCAANGICNGYPDLCKASVSLYNIFVRKTKALHTNIIEKLAIFFFLGVAPIFSVFLFQNYPIDNPYELKEIKDFPLMKFYLNKEKFTLIIYPMELNHIFSIGILFLMLVLFSIMMILVIFYIIPLEMELRRCQRLANPYLSYRIKNSIQYLRIYVILPTTLALIPFCICFFLSFIPRLQTFTFIFGSRFAIYALLYFNISPLFALHHAYKKKNKQYYVRTIINK